MLGHESIVAANQLLVAQIGDLVVVVVDCQAYEEENAQGDRHVEQYSRPVYIQQCIELRVPGDAGHAYGRFSNILYPARELLLVLNPCMPRSNSLWVVPCELIGVDKVRGDDIYIVKVLLSRISIRS